MNRILAVLFFLVLASDSVSGASSVPVRLRTLWATQPPKAVQEVTLRVLPEKSLSGEALPDAMERKLPVPGETTLELPAGFVWRLETTTPGTWAETLRVSSGPEPASRALEMRLFPSGVLKGRLETPAQEKIPSSFEIRFNSVPVPGPPRQDRVPLSTAVCAVQSGQWECPLPVGKLDVRLKAGVYIPVYRWGVEIGRDAPRDLGKIVLQQGTSVIGRVETEEGLPPGLETRVEIAPLRAADVQAVTTDRRLTALAQETRPNERGFFQFEGLPPGAYRVQASREGLTPASASPVEVHPGLESELVEPLVLARPVTLVLALEPALDPYGRPWKIGLLPGTTEQRGIRGAESFAGVATSEGTLEKHGLAPGAYILRISGEDGSTWVEQDVDLKAGDPPLRVRVPVIEVRGRISLGGEPLSATVWLGAPKGLRRVRFESNEEGRFEGWLPAEGTWTVDWVPAGKVPSFKLPLEPVDVRVPDGKSYASVEIRVPDTLLHGEVVDEQDRPLPGADISVVLPPARPARFVADEKGEFEIRGLKAGDLPILAEADERSSGWLQVRVEEGDESPRLHLVARRQVEIRGRVSSSSGPVPGAQVSAWPDFERSNMTGISDAVTGPSGEFKLTLPMGGDGPLNVSIFAPGYALRLLRISADPRALLQLPVEPAGGTLVVDYGNVEGAVVLHGGTSVPVQSLTRWAMLQRAERRGRGALVLPNVEVGEYVVCRGGEAYRAIRAGAPPPAAACAKGFVAPGQELVLKVPAPEEPAHREPAR